MFDPYHKWLGIPPKDQPPHHYRLLAINLFESDPEVIDAAANRQMSYVQQRVTGDHLGHSQRLLNELSAARLCLLDPREKSTYDAKLRAQLGEQPEAAGASPPAVASVDPLAFLDSGTPPIPGRTIEPPVIAPPPPPLLPMLPPLPTGPRTYRRHSRVSRQFPKFLLFAGGCLAAVALIVFVTWDGGQKPLARADKRAADTAKAGKKEADALSPRENSPETGKPAIYNVEIDPPSATLVVRNDRGTTSGEGKERQIRIADPSQRALIAASCDGYQTAQQWLDPKPGQNENLRIVLEKEPPSQEKPDPPPQESPGPAQPKEPVSPPHADLLAGAVFAMTFDPDAHGAMPLEGFNRNAYTAKGNAGESVAGKVGKALRFSNGSFLTVHGKFPCGQQPRTVSVWLKAAEGKHDQGHALVYGDSRSNRQIFCIQIVRGNWAFSTHGDVGPVDSQVAVDSSWHHHCLVYDGQSLIYTIDGAPVKPVPLKLNTSSGEMCLGGLFGKRTPFNGDVDELIVYDRALTATEIQQLYERGEDGISVLAAEPRPGGP